MYSKKSMQAVRTPTSRPTFFRQEPRMFHYFRPQISGNIRFKLCAAELKALGHAFFRYQGFSCFLGHA